MGQICPVTKSDCKSIFLKLETFKPRKTTISSTLLIRQRDKGTVVNQALPSLHKVSLEIPPAQQYL